MSKSPLNRTTDSAAASILCGTDFSDNARLASDVAAALAARIKTRLVLVHVVEQGVLAPRVSRSEANRIRTRLRKEAVRLRETGAQVEEILLQGKRADLAILEYAESNPPRFIVVSSVSKTPFERWTVGSIAEQIVGRSAAPTLVVRAPDVLVPWIQQKRALNVVVGVNFSSSSDAALAWVAGLSDVGPCNVTVAHVNWPPEDHSWVPEGKAPSMTENAPEVQRRLLREVRKRVRTWLGALEANVIIEPNWGRADAALLDLAARAGADLFVTGVGHHSGADRVAHGSVSRGILRHATTNVACIPVPPPIAHGTARPTHIRRILAATDFSEVGDQAIAWAFAALPAGGVIRLVHVLPPADVPISSSRSRGSRSVRNARSRSAEAEEMLSRLIPPDAAANGIVTELAVVTGRDPAVTIMRESRGFSPDVLCLGSRGHGALAGALLGSVVQRVMAGTAEPVLVVRPTAS